MRTPALSHASPDADWCYSPPAVILHWLVALLIVTLFGLGWYMMEIERQPGADWYFNLHRSLGLTVAALIVLRLIWRASNQPAPLPGAMPFWERKLSLAAHWLLYACMIVMPLTGYFGASYSKSGTAFFGHQLPFWSGPDRNLSKLFFTIHASLVWVFVSVIVLHALAGLKHLVVNRDKVFQRMWF